VRDPGQDWEVSLWAQNLFDRSPAPFLMEGVTYQGVAGGYSASVPPPRRKVGVTVRYEF
jgi:iron complex outermembrane receptor protein